MDGKSGYVKNYTSKYEKKQGLGVVWALKPVFCSNIKLALKALHVTLNVKSRTSSTSIIIRTRLRMPMKSFSSLLSMKGTLHFINCSNTGCRDQYVSFGMLLTSQWNRLSHLHHITVACDHIGKSCQASNYVCPACPGISSVTALRMLYEKCT